jgi:hypothetical protein
MAKQDVMDIWSALQWVVRDQKADSAFGKDRLMGDGRALGSITGRMIDVMECGVSINGSHGSMPDLDPDAEVVWLGVEMMFKEWSMGHLANEIGVDMPVRMHRYLAKLRLHPVVEMIKAARAGEMPDWMPGGWQNDSGLSRREVEESRLSYLLVYDALVVLSTRLQGSYRLGIVIEMPVFPRLPWNSRKKVEKGC